MSALELTLLAGEAELGGLAFTSRNKGELAGVSGVYRPWPHQALSGYNASLMDGAPRAPISDPVIDAYKKDVDRTLIRENLKLSVEERFLRLMELQRFAEELRRAGREARGKR